MSNETKSKLTKEQLSERMKRAWATRRANMAAAKGTAPAGSAQKQTRRIRAQIPSAALQTKVSQTIAGEFLDYLEFAINHKDSGILATERFRILMENIKPAIYSKK